MQHPEAPAQVPGPPHEIGKGFEVSKDQVIPISDDELAEMPLPTAKAIDIVAFVDRTSIDPIRLGDLLPDRRQPRGGQVVRPPA
ncbi:Ku protein [Streptomyces sp. NPDC006551]|uniref:Ku protein n=1 Tax=Streptomyces sp. NPDC006551 TaxID=3157178 RepID=UPI00339F5E00